MPAFMPMRWRIGPLTIITGPTGIVVASRPWMLNCRCTPPRPRRARPAGIRACSPPCTALIATFSTVHSTRSGGTTATMSSGAGRAVEHAQHPRFGRRDHRQAVAPTRDRTSPPLSSSSSASSTRRALAAGALEPDPQTVDEIAGRRTASRSRAHVGQVGAEAARRRSASPTRRATQPTMRSPSTPSSTRSSVGTVSISWCYDTARSASCRPCRRRRERRVVLREHGERDSGRGVELREHGFDHPARRAVALDDDHHTVRQQRSSPRRRCRIGGLKRRGSRGCGAFTTSGASTWRKCRFPRRSRRGIRRPA